nr:YadA-like family protein [Burkholderia cenocepacia]
MLGSGSTASANAAIVVGAQSVASGIGANVIGNNAVGSGDRAVALGSRASATGNFSVALGGQSVADRDNSVSVGSATRQRQITNVAAGTANTDAVNLGQMQTALSTKVDDTYVKIDTSNSTVAAQAGTAALAIGTNTSASGSYATAVGNSALANGNNSTALGFQATSSGGAAVAVGNGANASSSHGVALGVNAQASHTDSVALGASSITDRNNSVSVGSSTLRRQITNVAAGTADNDAVNVAQMNSGLSTTNAAIAATNLNVSSLSTGLSSTNSTVAGLSTDLSTTNSTVAGLSTGLSSTNSTVAGLSTGLSSTNSTVAGLSTGLSSTTSTVAGHTKQIGDLDDKLSKLESGTTGLVQQANPGDDITVGANTDGNAVDFSSKTGARTLKGVAAGDVSATSTEAVNGSQLHGVSDSVASAIGGGATVNPDGSISAPSFTVGDGSGGTKIVNSVGDVVTNLDGRVTTNEGDIKKLADDIGSGTLGLVQQAKPGDDITVGANTDGNAVDFSGKTAARTLKGVAAGDVSATSTEAVNGSQLHGVSESVASAIGGGATVNPDGSISAPSFTVGDGSGGTKIVNSVGDVVTNLDGRVTTNEGGLKKLSEQLESGTLGLVQQDAMTGGITVGANTGGSVVNFARTGGARVLSGVANGVDDDDVVTVSQLRATGLIDYTGKEVGAVTYDSGLNFDTVTFAGTFGTKLQRVAAGEISATSMDAINGSQLFDLQEQFAKQYGELSGQFGDLSNRFDDLSDRLGELETNPGTGGPGTGDGSTVVGEGAVASGENSSALGEKALASGENSSAVGQGAVASGSNGSAIGQGSTASGSNSSAVGQGAVASGNNGSAVGQGAVASGENGTALGQGSVASGKDSTALGQGASATGSGSVAIGQGSVATEANTVSFGNGTAEGNRRLVNIADGINASDAATKGQLDRAMESVDQRFNDTNRAINDVAKNAYAGIAAAMAMPNMTPSQPGKTVVAVGAANFKSGSAIAAGATYRSRSGNWLVNGATSITSVGDVGVRAQVGYEF